MKKRSFIFLSLVLIFNNITDADEDNYNTYSYIEVYYNLSSNISLNYEQNFKLDKLTANLSLVPLDYYMQKIESLEADSEPDAKISKGEGYIGFEWGHLYDFYEFNVGARLRILNNINKIHHVEFPINSLEPDYYKYLEYGNIIDINEDISNKANSLVKGETDLFEATFKIANWVKTNIKYDLNTLTSEAAQKASWVYKNREGVCDEITSLFIAMVRSVGIPARFVTGLVYTNIDHNFGSHGWAEVYFPGIGWVPFDVTFGEYGWLDPSHIKLSNNLDAGESAIKYAWRSYNVEINPNELSLDAKVLSTGQKIEPLFKLKVEPVFDQVGEESYVPIKVTVENPLEYYISDTLSITKAPDLLEQNNRQIMLRPLEKRSFFWTAKIPKYLNKKYVYRSEIEVQDTFGSKEISSLEYSTGYSKITFGQSNKTIVDLENSQNRIGYFNSIEFNCRPNKFYYNLKENAEISCSIKNLGNKKQDGINICVENSCNVTELDIMQEKNFFFNFLITNSSKKIITLSAKNDEINVNDLIRIEVFENGPLKMSNLEFPQTLNYKDEFTLNFMLSSLVPIKDVEIRFNNQDSTILGDIYESKIMEVPIKAKNYISKPLNISLSYNDDYRHYIFDKEVIFKINNIPWYIKMWQSIVKSFG